MKKPVPLNKRKTEYNPSTAQRKPPVPPKPTAPPPPPKPARALPKYSGLFEKTDRKPATSYEVKYNQGGAPLNTSEHEEIDGVKFRVERNGDTVIYIDESVNKRFVGSVPTSYVKQRKLLNNYMKTGHLFNG